MEINQPKSTPILSLPLAFFRAAEHPQFVDTDRDPAVIDGSWMVLVPKGGTNNPLCTLNDPFHSVID